MHPGQESREKFESWLAEREQLGDHTNWVFRDGLNKTRIAKACGFSSAQPFRGDFNPELRARAEAVEKDWRIKGIIPPKKNATSSKTATRKSNDSTQDPTEKKLEDAERRIKHLEERNAVLQAELNKYRHIAQHLAMTGRLMPL